MFKNVRLFRAGTKLPTKSTTYTVGGSADSDDIARWVDVLTTLLNRPRRKSLTSPNTGSGSSASPSRSSRQLSLSASGLKLDRSAHLHPSRCSR